MNNGWKAILYIIVLMVAPALCGASGLDSLKKTYAGINALEAKFHQKLFIENIKKAREFDGQFMWQDDEEKTFVLKERINKEKTGGTFFDLIEDITKIDDLFTLKQESVSGDMTVLDLVPKKEGNITAAKVWIDKQNLVRKIEIKEFTGNINTIEFSAVKVNQAISDAKFIYKPDKKKEIVEQ
jgi:outer membrane lipoprotein-sorting protein